MKRIPRGTFANLGSLLGGSGGRLIGSGISKVSGYGDYQSARAGGSGMGRYPVPRMSNGPRSTIISHREYIQDVISSATPGLFLNQSFPINPGMVQTFPWLSQIAVNYEEFKVRGMIFEYKSNSADALNSTNTALGTVILATDYNPLNAIFNNKQQMENSEFAYSDRPSVDIRHPIECARKDNVLGEFFVRSAAPSGSDYDLRFTDLGNFQIASVGQQGASVNLGELWVTYTIEFLKPILGASVSPSVQSSHLISATGVSGTVQTTLPFGSLHGTTFQPGSNIAVTLSSNTVTFPVNMETGTYQLTYYIQGTSATINCTGWGNPVNCTQLTVWDGDVLPSAQGPQPGVASVTYMATCLIAITAPGSLQASITLNTTVIPTSGSYDLWITQVTPTIVT
jgi:hypothetical protein